MKLSDDEYEYIKQEVIDLFERYCVRCIPISGFELAMSMGIVLIPYSSLSENKLNAVSAFSPDGFFWEPGDGKEYIYYNDSIGYKRSNMTVLHEIGHDVLGHHVGMDPEFREAEASFFTKYAAAPPPLIHRLAPKEPEEIEKHFGISHEAAIIAFGYYHKWLYQYMRSGRFQAYEIRLLNLFTDSQGGEYYDIV